MLSQLFHYTRHRLLASGDIRLAMTILVKNEADIIRENIRTHASLGVDCFVVMDNGSTDGTREILAELQQHYELHIIDQPAQSYRQRQWMTELAFVARDKMGADWVISNDADEFWIPKEGDLKKDLDRKGSVITCHRYNMLLTEDCHKPGYRFHDSTLRVNHPIYYEKQAQRIAPNISIVLAKIAPKVIINPYGLFRIKGGNHRALHIANATQQRFTQDITVYHYPIRSYAQFERNVTHRQKLAQLKDIRMGDHYFRWVKILEAGKLEEEFNRFVFSDKDIDVLSRFGVVVEDDTPHQTILRANPAD